MEEVSAVVAVLGVLVGVMQTKYARKQARIAEKANTQNKQFKRLFSEEDQLLTNVGMVLNKLEEILMLESKSGSIQIKNYGLDLETVVPWLLNNVGLNTKLSLTHIDYKGLLINPSSNMIRYMIDEESDLKSVTVASRTEEIKKLDVANLSKMEVELRQYDSPPVIHGFLINEKFLFLSFTEIQKNKIKGGSFPYTFMEYNHSSKLNCHYFNMFKTWFEYTWHISNSIYKN